MATTKSTTAERARKRSFYASDRILRSEGKCVRIFRPLTREERDQLIKRIVLRFGDHRAQDLVLVPVEQIERLVAMIEPGGGGGEAGIAPAAPTSRPDSA